MTGHDRWRWRHHLVMALAMTWAAWQALARLWVCDDAFLSFRYAQNLVAGHGLVFNAEERVEGFTNFSWTMLCALAIRLGADPVRFAQLAGVLCYVAVIPVTAWAGRRLLPGDRAYLPLAAIAVALHHHLQDFASCGLETAAFVLLTVALVGTVAAAATPGAWAAAGLLAGLASLTRPDGALFGLLAGIASVRASWLARRWQPFLAYGIPALLLLVPFLAWRLSYYGELLPNTFYAKSAYEAYAAQGWFYVWLFLSAYWVLLPAAALLPAALLAARRGGAAPWLACCVLVYGDFVIWVGGDFMFARFLLPVTPLLYLVLEWTTRRYLHGRQRWAALVVVAVGTLCWHQRQDLLVVGQNVQGVADERAQYPAERVAAIRGTGVRLRELMGEVPLRVAFSGTQAMLVYEARVPYALEAMTGLTDWFLARRSLSERGIPGHEKSLYASVEAMLYAIDERQVHLLLEDLPVFTGPQPWRKLQLPGQTATLVRWDPAVMARLRGAPDVAFVEFPQWLDGYLQSAKELPLAQLQNDLVSFEQFYFRWNDDPARRAALQAAMVR